MSSNPIFVDDFWNGFGDGSSFIEVTCDQTNVLINDILTTFGINGATNANKGGNLDNLDIKHMDALMLINLSLLEGAIDSSRILEVIVNEEGEVEIIEIGASGKGFGGTDVYYELQSAAYSEDCVGVMLTGGAPLVERLPLTWVDIWGKGSSSSKKVWDTTTFVTNCNMPNYSTTAIITYNDPHTRTDFDDGINNLYEITRANAFDKIVGYATAIHATNKTIDTKISQHLSAIVPIPVTGVEGNINGANLGTLQEKPTFGSTTAPGVSADCYTGTGGLVGSYSDGVPIPLDAKLFFDDVRGMLVSKFIKVAGVYIIGYQFDTVYSIPVNDQAAADHDQGDYSNMVIGDISNAVKTTFKLEEGKHYSILYGPPDATGNSTFKQPYILFTKGTRPGDPKSYGQNTEFYLNPACTMAEQLGTLALLGSILPLAQNRGFLVEQVFAMVEVDTPAIVVTDPEFNYINGGVNDSMASDIAEALEYKIAPIVVRENPAPIVIRSQGLTGIIDQTAHKTDNDPTTAQNFDDTPYELAMDEMDKGSGITLTLSFIEDADKLLSLADTIYDYMNAEGSDPTVTTYICGPEATPNLGAKGDNGGIINEITYSYTDSSSYTISVNEGPWMVSNLSAISAATSFKASSDYSTRATIIEDMGNHIYYKVRIDGYGIRIAINTAPAILKIGDVVTVTVHNNPVEA